MFVFVSSIGRSGTRYISELAGSMLPFPCHHVAKPYCHGQDFVAINQGLDSAELSAKWDVVSAEAKQNGGHYFESNPLFVRGFGNYFFDQTDDIAVIQLLRDPLIVAKSYTNRDSYPSHASRPWRLPLNTVKSMLSISGQLHPFQENLVDWLENELRFNSLRNRISRIETLRFTELIQGKRLQDILTSWSLPVTPITGSSEGLDQNANKVATEISDLERGLAHDLITRLGEVDFDRSLFERGEYKEFEFIQRIINSNYQQ